MHNRVPLHYSGGIVDLTISRRRNHRTDPWSAFIDYFLQDLIVYDQENDTNHTLSLQLALKLYVK